MRSVRGLGILLLFLAGCSQPRSEPLVKTKIELLKAQAAEYESLGTKEGMLKAGEVQKRLDKIQNDIAENETALRAIPGSEVKDTEAKYRTELIEASERSRKAQRELLKLIFRKMLPQ